MPRFGGLCGIYHGIDQDFGRERTPLAQKLSQAERQRITTDFDPPVAAQTSITPPLNSEKSVRVTATLSALQYTRLQEIANARGLSLSRTLAEAVMALYENGHHGR